MSRSRYETMIDGIGIVVPNRERFRFACCECGLVHDVVIAAPKVKKGTDLGFAVRRNNRATAQRRRSIKRKKK